MTTADYRPGYRERRLQSTRLVNLTIISEKVKCRSLIKDVNIKCKGDNFAAMDIMILLTSSGVTGESILSAYLIRVHSDRGEVASDMVSIVTANFNTSILSPKMG